MYLSNNKYFFYCCFLLLLRLDVAKDDKASFPIDSEQSGSALSMKNLIAAAQARKRQSHSQSSYGNPLLFLFPEADIPRPGLRQHPNQARCSNWIYKHCTPILLAPILINFHLVIDMKMKITWRQGEVQIIRVS